MRTARRVTLLLALLAMGWGAARLVLPVRVEIGSLMPGAFGEVIPGFVTNNRVSCGSVLSPAEYSGSALDDLGSAPARLLRLDCPRARQQAAASAAVWIGFGAVVYFLGLILLRDARRPITVGASSTVRSNEAFSTSPAPVVPAPVSEPPRHPAPVAPPDAGPPVPARAPRPRSRFSPYQWTAFGGVGALIVLFGAVMIGLQSDDAPASSLARIDPFPDAEDGFPSTTAYDPIEQTCVVETIQRDAELRDLARAESQRDQDEAILNLDGDSSYIDYANAIDDLSLRDCPDLFRTAFDTWVAAWYAYASDFQHGGDDVGSLVRVIQAADDGLRAAAVEVNVELAYRSWSLTSD